MKDFVSRVINNLHKVHSEQLMRLLTDLATQNERFVMVLDSLNDGIAVTDTNHRLVLINKPAERMLNMPMRVSQQLIWESIEDKDVAHFVQETLLSDSRVLERDFNFSGTGGKLLILSCSIYPLVHSGSIQGNFLFIRDVTERRMQDAQLRRAENLASLTTLAAGVAHEIKNPLASISIHVQLMQKTLRNKDNINVKYLERYIDIVNEEVDRLNNTVVDFLFSVRPMDLTQKKMDINQIMSDILDFVKYELKSKKIVVKRNFTDDMPLVSIDARYVKQAILNLIKNSMVAMPEGGELVVGTTSSDSRVQLSICDTGVGMSQETIRKVFEPYFSTSEDGSGLGMTFVYKIMKEHGGDIQIDSKVNKGSCMTLSFPIPQSEKHLIK